MKICRALLVGLLMICLTGAVASAAGAVGPPPSEASVDFSSHGFGALDPDFYRSDGIVFPGEQCGAAGCMPPEVVLTQDDAALVGLPRFGPVEARFTRPISAISLRVAPRLQGTATYTLRAFAGSGELVDSVSVTVTQDFGDPENTGFGYFTISLEQLDSPAKSFTLDSVFVRSSFPFNQEIDYGISSIVFTHWPDTQS
jgi:hypothetical protein